MKRPFKSLNNQTDFAQLHLVSKATVCFEFLRNGQVQVSGTYVAQKDGNITDAEQTQS